MGGLSLRGTVRAECTERDTSDTETDRHAGMETEGRPGQMAVRAHAHVCMHTRTHTPAGVGRDRKRARRVRAAGWTAGGGCAQGAGSKGQREAPWREPC